MLPNAKVRSIARALYTVGGRLVEGRSGRMTGKKRRKKGPPKPKKTTDSPQRLATKARIREERRELKRASEAGVRRKLVEECVDRICRPEEREAFLEVLWALVENNVIPASLLTTVPQKASKAGSTRFDQIYDVCMFLAFPDYAGKVRERAFGPGAPESLKLWRVLLPKEYGLSHVVIRAQGFPEAFALACDYACRLSLREHRRIPGDLTVRVQFVPDQSAARMLDIRRAVKYRQRVLSGTKGRQFSAKDVAGARLVAIGPREGNHFSVFKMAENLDLRALEERRGIRRLSAVDKETFRPPDDGLVEPDSG